MAKIELNAGNLSSEQVKTLAKVVQDVFYFSLFIFVVHPVRGKVHFNLYPYQKSVLYQFVKNQFNIILKFRQAGITELISMYCLWLAMYHPNKKINIISIKDSTAKKVLKKIKYMYKNLPWYLQVPIVNGRTGEYGSSSMIEFNNGSFIESIPTSSEAGRSESLSLLVIDEAAIVRWADRIWAAAFPTLSTGGSAIINSCITGDTQIIGRNGNFRVEQVCPKEFGVQDIRFMDLYVLTHKLRWRKALYGVNKGILETWEVKDNRGKTIKCTPAHKFYTIKGWKPLREIVDKGLYVIQQDMGLSELQEPPITQKPEHGILKDIPRYSGYMVSNTYISKLEVVRKYSDNIYDITVDEDESYVSVDGYVSHNTPYGIGNFYHSKWVDAISGGNQFIPIRLFWRMHPERDLKWYNQMSTALGPKRTAQEIDGDFLSSGNSVFDLMDIKAIEDCLSEFPIIKRRYNGQYLQFNEPELDKDYFIGADVATGRATDYSAFTCMDKSGEEVAVYKGRMSVDKYARLLGDTGQLFNWATIAPESNDVGLAVTSMLQAEGYPKLYYFQKMVKKKGKTRPEVEKAPGWMTTAKNRPVIIDGLEADIRNDVITCKDPFFVYEAKTFIYDSLGRPVAMGKHKTNSEGDDLLSEDVYADDDIMGKAICNHIRKGKQNIIIQPR